jgi:hypothetical protein
VPERHFFDASQPQTLQGAVMLSYINAAFGVVMLLAGGLVPLVLVQVAEGVGAYGIANERRWGYRLGVGSSVLILVVGIWWFVFGHANFLSGFLSLLFSLLLAALLLHPQSREYQRIWFN